ncbi:MAG: hypothetical protein KKA84_11305 [Bacteroidetes bacterium]|nr:hypothetical protein [Bacteroidota bacterium]
MNKKLTTIILITFLSTLLWVFTSLSEEYFTTLTLPVMFVDIPENYAIGDCSPRFIEISLKGGGWQLAQLTYGRNPAYMLSPEYRTGKHKYILRNAIDGNSWLTSTLQVTDIQPAQVNYTVERVVTREVLVKPDVKIDFKEGYGLVSAVQVHNDTVKISGASSKVDSINFLTTKLFHFENLEKGVYQQIEIKAIPDIVMSHNICTIEFEVQKIVDKSFENVEVVINDVPRRRELLLFPNKITVVIRGGINVLGQLDDNSVKSQVSFMEAITDTTGSLIPHITIPENTTLIDFNPKSLGYIIKQY